MFDAGQALLLHLTGLVGLGLVTSTMVESPGLMRRAAILCLLSMRRTFLSKSSEMNGIRRMNWSVGFFCLFVCFLMLGALIMSIKSRVEVSIVRQLHARILNGCTQMRMVYLAAPRC